MFWEYHCTYRVKQFSLVMMSSLWASVIEWKCPKCVVNCCLQEMRKSLGRSFFCRSSWVRKPIIVTYGKKIAECIWEKKYWLFVYLFSSRGSVSCSVVKKDSIDYMNSSRFIFGLMQCIILPFLLYVVWNPCWWHSYPFSLLNFLCWDTLVI